MGGGGGGGGVEGWVTATPLVKRWFVYSRYKTKGSHMFAAKRSERYQADLAVSHLKSQQAVTACVRASSRCAISQKTTQ